MFKKITRLQRWKLITIRKKQKKTIHIKPFFFFNQKTKVFIKQRKVSFNNLFFIRANQLTLNKITNLWARATKPQLKLYK